MKEQQARKILMALVHGLDPLTGDELPATAVLQNADVLRALLAGAMALQQMAARTQRRAQLPGKVGHAWTPEEEQRLLAAFKSGEAPADIATRHARTLRAIEARLERLGLLSGEERTTRDSLPRAPLTRAKRSPPSG
jgi:hypothetical protein